MTKVLGIESFQADEVCVLIDGENYLDNLKSSLEAAKNQILLVGWDFHPDVVLDPKGDEETLSTVLERCSQKNPELEIYVLGWDYNALYWFERSPATRFRLSVVSPPNVSFSFDSHHPVLAAHHQKVVVIDDSLAFLGGIDLTTHRWDTRGHHDHDPRRKTPGGEAYAPFHDCQLAVTGEAAAKLGNLCRQRWNTSNEKKLSAPNKQNLQCIKPGRLRFATIKAALALTQPAYGGRPANQSILKTYLAMFKNAQRYIYVENQFLSSEPIVASLCDSLKQSHGPDVTLVLPAEQSGWLEEQTMGAERKKNLTRLQQADTDCRLRIITPRTPKGTAINVHSKLAIVDDRWFRVGSANLSGRSMGLDSECDLLCEVESSEHTAVLQRMLGSLLAEHLHVDPLIIASSLRQRGLSATVDYHTEEDDLRCISRPAPAPKETVLTLAKPTWDGSSPLGVDQAVEKIAKGAQENISKYRWAKLALGALLLCLVAALWQYTPVAEWLHPEILRHHALELRTHWWSPPFVALSMAVLATMMVPVTGLIAICGGLYGPLLGTTVAVSGGLLGAVMSYAVGALLTRLAEPPLTLQRIGKHPWLKRRAFEGVFLCRIIPVAPFSMLNMAAGYARIPFRPYLLATAVGLTPGSILASVFGDGIFRWAAERNFTALGYVLSIVLVIGLTSFFLRRRFGRRLAENTYQHVHQDTQGL